MNQDIIQRLKELRNELNYTQKDFAEKLGISRTYYSNIENGNAIPKESILKLISFKFNISFDWLISGKGSKYKSYSIDTVEGSRIKYNEMRVFLENFLANSESTNSDSFKLSVLSYSYFVSILTAPKLKNESALSYQQAILDILDNLEKLLFSISVHNKKNDYETKYNNLKKTDDLSLLIKEKIDEIEHIYIGL